jgi:hypothetical protein
MCFEQIEKLLEELIDQQQKQVVGCAETLMPHLTEEDLLQPNDFPQLEQHPFFRYEEGVLAGLKTAQMAFFALKKDLDSES